MAYKINDLTEDVVKDFRWLQMCVVGASVMRKCSKAQYFSYVLDDLGRVRGCGYNGTPSGLKDCVDGGCPRAKKDVPAGTPYNFGDGLCLSNHAEMNALIGIDRAVLFSATLFVNGVCCFGCAKEICGAGIKRVVGIDRPDIRSDHSLTEQIFDDCGVDWVLFDWRLFENT